MKRVLVAIDFSYDSLNALDYGIKIANRLGADLRIVHIRTRKNYSESFVKDDVELVVDGSIDGWMAKLVERSQEKYRVVNGLLDYKIREGNVVMEITNQAKYDDTSLLVVGTHGASGFEEKWIGSNAFRLVSHAPCPVLTVRKDMKWKGIEKVVLPIDFRKESRRKVPVVSGFAKLFNAGVHIVGLKHSDVPFIFNQIRAFVRQVESFVEKKAGLRTTSTILSGKNLSGQLLDHAVSEGADVISIRINSANNFFSNMIKPYGNDIINNSPIPVLAVPTNEK